MPNYNYLTNNESDFPHISNVDTFKYDNDFDYGRFDYTQMELTLCSVPWDMGEAHIGNRTISGIGNVVYFGNKANRDAWFAAIPDSECYRFNTKFKELHRDYLIDVPIPYDMCAKHNYLVVKYSKFANDDSPVQYEGEDGLREWFWFVREVEFVAPNTTRLHLLDDAFQTWIYDVNVSGMILERGHAPMFSMKATDYLKNPIANNSLLLTEDVNFGDANIVKHIDAVAFNDGQNVYACIATTANPQGSWGSKAGGDWNTPTLSALNNGGVPSVYVFAVAASNLGMFLANIDTSFPQFKQTVQGVFFATDTLLTLGTSFTFASTTCYPVSATRKSIDFVELSKSQFGYPSDYDEIAKLYTFPYAHIEICDENGDVEIVRVEDTDGTIDISAALSLAYPFVNIDVNLLGVGGSASKTVTFKNIDSHSLTISGKWYETLRTWNVPMFAVVQQASTEYDYSTHFDRAQQVTDYTTAQTNANASADTLKTNQDNLADTAVSNTAVSNTASSASTARSNQSAETDALNTTTVNTWNATQQAVITSFAAQSTVAANEQQAAISSASTIASGLIASRYSAFNGELGSTFSSIENALIGAATVNAQTSVAVGLTQVEASYTNHSNGFTNQAANNLTNYKKDNQTATQTDLTDISNNAATAMTANNAATTKGNATNDQTTLKANAQREANRAQSAIDNSIKQAALNAPRTFGSWTNGDSAVTKPMAIFAHVVTENEAAIASAGDEMLRYGYTLDRQWNFDGNWNVGKYFTYWKLRDFWVSDLNVPDMYMDKLRFFLFGGVTIWSAPEYIGKKSIYENFS